MTEYQVLTVKCKMLVQPERVSVLDETVSRFTEACNYALKTARDTDTWNRIKLHHLTYHSIRERLGLSANLVVQAIRRVAKKGERAHILEPVASSMTPAPSALKTRC